MTPAQAQATLEFLGRCELKGSEAPILMECAQALQTIIEEATKDDRQFVEVVEEEHTED